MTSKTHKNQYMLERIQYYPILSNTIHVSQCPCCNNVVDKSLIGNGIPNQLSSYAYLIFVIACGACDKYEVCSYGYYIHYVHYVFSYGYSFHTLIASFLCSEVAGLYFIIAIHPVCTVHFCSHITAMLANKWKNGVQEFARYSNALLIWSYIIKLW